MLCCTVYRLREKKRLHNKTEQFLQNMIDHITQGTLKMLSCSNGTSKLYSIHVDNEKQAKQTIQCAQQATIGMSTTKINENSIKNRKISTTANKMNNHY